jgi:signal transduction histidine kinase
MILDKTQKHLPTPEQAQSIEKTFQQPMARRPWWRCTFAGYVFALPIVVLTRGATLLEEHLLHRYYFPSAFMLVAILCVALFWGNGPGLLTTILSSLALLVFYVLPVGEFSMAPFDWDAIFQIFPFVIAGIVVVFITAQREAARARALEAEQVASERAKRLTIMNEELQQANQLKDLFLSIASHELKTPITTIRGQAQLALRRIDKRKDDAVDTHGLRETLVKVDDQTKRLTDLVNKLLDINSLRSGKLVLDLEPSDLSKICHNVVEEQHLLSGRTIDLVLSVAPLVLTADANRLTQVFTNLVNNALKYSSPESPVKVEVTRDERVVLVSVQDAGQGISASQLASIFEPFYRTSEARASSVSGAGLGLAICKDIIERHHGRIWCESIEDQGSTFFVELPLSTQNHF